MRTADCTDPQSLSAALAGADKVLLISGSEVGQRTAQHQNVVTAAERAGVGHLVYTRVLRADTSELGLAAEHKATEQAIRASGIPFTFLRNGWYTENYAQLLAQAAESGTLIGSAGDGKVASAARADYADAAVAVLAGEGHEGKVYELAGDAGWTFPELAAELGKTTGRRAMAGGVDAAVVTAWERIGWSTSLMLEQRAAGWGICAGQASAAEICNRWKAVVAWTCCRP